MIPKERTLPSALEEARRRRLDMGRTLAEVAKALSGLERWKSQVARGLERVRQAIDEHVEVTEGPGGLYEDIMDRAPRLAGRIERLRGEHPALQHGAAVLLARLQSAPIGDVWCLERTRDDVHRFLGLLVRHRQLGANLVWEAYNHDIGGLE